MRNKSLHSIMFALLLVVLFIPTTFSQTFNLVFANDVMTTSKEYHVDIFVQNTDANPMELGQLTLGLQFEDAARNGGTVTATWIAGTCGLSNTNQQSGKTGINATGTAVVGGVTYRIIKMAGQTTPGYGNGSILSSVAPGTRIGTLKLLNTADWKVNGSGINYSIGVAPMSGTGAYPSSMSIYAYGTGVNTPIWSATVLSNVTIVKNLQGPVLPVELSSFASASQGRTVVLNWSTKTEKNSDRFEVERSVVGNETWSTVGTVKASVLSNSTKNYSYSDTKLQSGKYQYRLKMVDNNGSFTYSTVEAAEVAVPKDFSVSQNYPNPFNPSTKIDYQVPVDAKVIMEVYNIAGQKVMELVNGQMSAGYYTVDFGASKLSSGVYIYRLSASDVATGHNFSSIKKMMLLK